MQLFRRPAPCPPPKVPRTLFLFNGPSGRLIVCETRDLEPGLLELRLEWADEVVGTNVFGGPDREERALAAAADWRQWLIEHGYTESDRDIPVMWADIRLVIPLAMLAYAVWRMFTSAGG